MKLSLILLVFIISISPTLACNNISYQTVGTLVVSPHSSDYDYFSMLPFRGKIDYVKITRHNGGMSPFEVSHAYMEHNYGQETDLWFDYPDDNAEEGVIAETRLRSYDYIMGLYIEISNRTSMLRFFHIDAGKCMD